MKDDTHEACHDEHHQHEQDSPVGLSQYKPLIVILAFCVVMSWAQSGSLGVDTLMYPFMGYFFVFLSLFKFFDLKGFVDGFETYDLITTRVRGYGYLYPFIELGLGLAYLAHFELATTNFVTFVVMLISGMGVLKAMLSGQKIKCACLGTALNMPLSTVSVLENLGMGAMAAFKLLGH